MKYVFPAIGGYILGLLLSDWLTVKLRPDDIPWLIFTVLMCFGFTGIFARMDSRN